MQYDWQDSQNVIANVQKPMDWDDLRVFLAVSRKGTLSGAARVLAVNHSTVFRRLNALEANLNVRLFERLPTGYEPTVAGEALSEAAGKAEAEILAAERALAGQDLRLSGALRITMPDTLARLFLPSLIAPFVTPRHAGGMRRVVRPATVVAPSTLPFAREGYGYQCSTQDAIAMSSSMKYWLPLPSSS